MTTETQVVNRTWADAALDECVGLYDFPVPIWVDLEAVDKSSARLLDGFGPPLVRYQGPDGSAVIQRGVDVWAGYSALEVMESPRLKYASWDGDS